MRWEERLHLHNLHENTFLLFYFFPNNLTFEPRHRLLDRYLLLLSRIEMAIVLVVIIFVTLPKINHYIV
jgi:hypothetical protein